MSLSRHGYQQATDPENVRGKPQSETVSQVSRLTLEPIHRWHPVPHSFQWRLLCLCCQGIWCLHMKYVCFLSGAIMRNISLGSCFMELGWFLVFVEGCRDGFMRIVYRGFLWALYLECMSKLKFLFQIN